MGFLQQLKSLSLHERKEILDLNAISDEELKEHCGLSYRLAK